MQGQPCSLAGKCTAPPGLGFLDAVLAKDALPRREHRAHPCIGLHFRNRDQGYIIRAAICALGGGVNHG